MHSTVQGCRNNLKKKAGWSTDRPLPKAKETHICKTWPKIERDPLHIRRNWQKRHIGSPCNQCSWTPWVNLNECLTKNKCFRWKKVSVKLIFSEKEFQSNWFSVKKISWKFRSNTFQWNKFSVKCTFHEKNSVKWISMEWISVNHGDTAFTLSIK